VQFVTRPRYHSYHLISGAAQKKELRNGINSSGGIVMEGGRFRLSGSAHDRRPADPPAAPTPYGTTAHLCTQAQQYCRLQKIIMSNEA